MQLSWVLLAALATPAWGQSGAVDVRSSIYQDSDRTFISTTAVAGTAQPIEEISIKARYLIDVVSTASVDVVSAATESFEENRHEATASVSLDGSRRSLGVSYIYSHEPDWMSHTVGASASHDFLRRNLTVVLGAAVGTNDVGRAEDSNFSETLRSAGGSLSATVLLGPKALLNATYSFSYLAGFQSSPYRFVYFAEPDGDGRTISQAETHPDRRARHAVSVRWIRHVFTDSAIRADARGYADDWGVRSLTAGVEYVVGLGDFDLGIRARGYLQRGADFYQSTYDRRRRFMSADRELSPFVDGFSGVRLRWQRALTSVVDDLRAEVKVEGFGFLFFDFPRLPSRGGVIAELAVGASF